MAKTTKRKPKKNIVRGIAHIKASFNNTNVTITAPNGDTVSWAPRVRWGSRELGNPLPTPPSGLPIGPRRPPAATA